MNTETTRNVNLNVNVLQHCEGACWPVYIQIGLAIIAIIMTLVNKGKNKLSQILGTVLYALLAVFIEYHLCKNCHNGWAWAILLLPVILTVISLLLVVLTINGLGLVLGRK